MTRLAGALVGLLALTSCGGGPPFQEETLVSLSLDADFRKAPDSLRKVARRGDKVALLDSGAGKVLLASAGKVVATWSDPRLEKAVALAFRKEGPVALCRDDEADRTRALLLDEGGRIAEAVLPNLPTSASTFLEARGSRKGAALFLFEPNGVLLIGRGSSVVLRALPPSAFSNRPGESLLSQPPRLTDDENLVVLVAFQVARRGIEKVLLRTWDLEKNAEAASSVVDTEPLHFFAVADGSSAAFTSGDDDGDGARFEMVSLKSGGDRGSRRFTGAFPSDLAWQDGDLVGLSRRSNAFRILVYR